MNINLLFAVIIILFSIIKLCLWRINKIYLDRDYCDNINSDTCFEKYLFVFFNKRSSVKLINIIPTSLFAYVLLVIGIDDLERNGIKEFLNSGNGKAGVFLVFLVFYILLIVFWVLRAMVYLPNEDEPKNEG
jgi:hypothetical protein